MKIFLKNSRKLFLFVFAATLFTGVAYTSSDFFTAPVSGFKDAVILLFQWAVIMFAVFPVICLLSLNKYVFAVFYPLICLLSGILTWFRYTAGTTLTTMILDAALDNDAKINAEMIEPGLILVAAGSLLISILFAVYRFKRIGKIDFWYLHILIGLVWLFTVFHFYQIKRPVSERIPMNMYFIVSRYLSEKREILTIREPLPGQIICNENKPIVVLIIGESLRPDHLGLNGYERNTTPQLSKEDVISFPNIYSSATYTNASLPQILTRADSVYPGRAESERSFIDIFKRCGYYTIWLANQEPAKSYVYFMNECDTLVYGNITKSSYIMDRWTDELLLPAFDHFSRNIDGNRLFVLHTIGSHWYYNAHYTGHFRQFTPVVKSRIVSSNTPEEMINSYDNTVLYTDYFISTIINRLRDKNAVLAFLSDHGEALGENGAWLHATDVPQVHNTACLLWLSPEFKANNPQKDEILLANRNRPYNTGFLFHTILQLAGIESDIIEKEKSLLYNFLPLPTENPELPVLTIQRPIH